MASGVIAPGGFRLNRPGGLKREDRGGVSFANNQWALLSGHPNVDAVGPLVSSGARTAQTRSVKNPRKDARTTAISYAWTLPTVPGGSTTAVSSITGGSTATATFTPDVAGTYVFRCTVTYTKAAGNQTQVVNYSYTSA